MSHRENLRKARAHLIESFEKGLQPAGVVALQGFEVASWLVSVPPSVLITLQTPRSALCDSKCHFNGNHVVRSLPRGVTLISEE